MIEIESPYMKFCCRRQDGQFDLIFNDPQQPHVTSASMAVQYFWRGVRYTHLAEGWNIRDQRQGTTDIPFHGQAERLDVELAPDARGLSCRLIFALCKNRPLFLWKAILRNDGNEPLLMNRITLLDTLQNSRRVGKIPGIHFLESNQKPRMAFFSNGWQSWSAAGAYRFNDAMRQTNLAFFQEPMIHNPGTPQPRRTGFFSADMFGILGSRKTRQALLTGFLSQKQHFGSILADVREHPGLQMWANGDNARLDPGRTIETDWAVMSPILVDDPDPWKEYLQAAARENGVRVPEQSPVGWCSWYHYYTHITAQEISDNLVDLQNKQEILPVELVQIDDGFEAKVGDWFEFMPAFPAGVKPLAEEIRAAGKIPGLWLAPFIVHPGSRLAKEHPEYLLRTRSGRRANAGFVWNSLGCALDLTEPAALDYACRVVHTAAHKWGYPYLKLDFLYAAALKGVYRDGTKTRAQVLRKGMESIRKAAGENTVLLGCGAPLGSVLGLVDAMRIGADVAGNWKPKFGGVSLPFRNEPSMPSARASLQNIMSRALLHRHWWINDPDCLLIRPNTELTPDEIRTLTSAIGLAGGSLLISDGLPDLPDEHLNLAACLLPVIGRRPEVLDWLDANTPGLLKLHLDGPTGGWDVIGIFNWEDGTQTFRLSPGDLRLEEGKYSARSFWCGHTYRFGDGQPLEFDLPAHACAVLAVRRANHERAEYLGSSLHLSQGLEVEQWLVSRSKVILHLQLNRQAKGRVDLQLPEKPAHADWEGQCIAWDEVSPGVYRFAVDLRQHGRLVVDLKS